MVETKDLKALVDQMPELDKTDAKNKRDEGKLTGPTWGEAEKVYDQVLAGGRDSLAGLIGMIQEVDDGKDYKVRYLLHGVAVYCCRPGKEEQRGMVIDAIASQIGDRPKPVQAFLIQELETVGDGRVAGLLGRLLTDEELYAPATRALMAIGKGAAELLRAALPRAGGRARVSAVQNLGVLRDAESTEALKAAAVDQAADVRIAAVWGLANLGDAGAADVVLKAADAPEGWERIEAAKACLVLAEKLRAAGRKDVAARIYTYLRDSRKGEAESYVRNAAAQALAGAG